MPRLPYASLQSLPPSFHLVLVRSFSHVRSFFLLLSVPCLVCPLSVSPHSHPLSLSPSLSLPPSLSLSLTGCTGPSYSSGATSARATPASAMSAHRTATIAAILPGAAMFGSPRGPAFPQVCTFFPPFFPFPSGPLFSLPFLTMATAAATAPTAAAPAAPAAVRSTCTKKIGEKRTTTQRTERNGHGTSREKKRK